MAKLERYNRFVDGLTVWRFLHGMEWVGFDQLSNEMLTGYFIFHELVDDGLLDMEFNSDASHSFKLTEKAIDYLRSHDGNSN